MSAAASATIHRITRVSQSGWTPRPELVVIRNMQTLSWTHEPLQHAHLLRGRIANLCLQGQPIRPCIACTTLRLNSSQPEGHQQQPSSVVDKLRKPCQRGTSPEEARRLHSMEEWQARTTLKPSMHASLCMQVRRRQHQPHARPNAKAVRLPCQLASCVTPHVWAGHSLQAGWQRGRGHRNTGEHGPGAQVTPVRGVPICSCCMPILARQTVCWKSQHHACCCAFRPLPMER